jgi:signal transduction histidine kinase
LSNSGAGWLLVGVLAMLMPSVLQAQPASPAAITIDRAEAARADWRSTAPPTSGWTPVELIDYWNTRWPQHDGVVWYRLHWNQANADTPVGLLLDYVCMADAVYVNGSLVRRDPQLVEPLSRSWVAPQYFLIDQPLLHAGDNIVLVRISGFAAYQPGFGVVTVGDPATVHAQYRHKLFHRYGVRQFNFAISAVLGVLFGMFWLLRRKDTVYGWYALTTLLGAGYSWNYVTASPWPFASTDAWQAFIAALLVSSVCGFMVFLLRFCSKRWPRAEAAMLAVSISAFAFALLAPQVMGPWRNVWIMPAIAVYYMAIGWFLWHAARTQRVDVRVLGLSMLLPVLISFHDLALYLQLTHGSTYLGALTSPLGLLGMSFAVAWRFAEAMRRVEGFNLELKYKVDAATTQLGETLAREHLLALSHTRIGERMNLVRDLHDGFGGSLLGTIATLEQSPPSPETAHTLTALKELRDDLRLVIDTTTHEQDTDLAGLLASLRHRWGQRLNSAGIDSYWRLEGLDQLHLGAARSLDLLRLLQEALTNVLKHSGAGRADVAVIHDDRHLRIEVRDDGRGFDPAVHSRSGAGLASLRARAARLGGQLAINAVPTGGTTLQTAFPL